MEQYVILTISMLVKIDVVHRQGIYDYFSLLKTKFLL